MRITGFIALAVFLTVAIGAVVISNLQSSIPEPHASCIQAWQEEPDSPLRPFGGADLRLDEERSEVDGDRILSHVGPVSRSSGQPVTLQCIEINGAVKAETEDAP